MPDSLPMVIVYERPTDAPEHYVVRRWHVVPGESEPRAEGHAAGFIDEANAHTWIAQQWPDLTLLHGRRADPDPCIIAVYV